jgi:DNA (cytosine-5)-methyltransferase 1
VVDIFCGIGGLTHGLLLSGLRVIAGVDIDPSCRYAYEKNNKTRFIEADIVNLQSDEIAKLYPEYSIKILVGCAPCQPFSRYAKRYQKKGYACNKWQLLYSFTEKIQDIKPEIISMENVPELSKSEVFTDFVNSLRELNYHIFWDIIYCPCYGVPQKRRRLVLLASTLGAISFIPRKYTPETYLTVHDAIGELPKIEAGNFLETDVLHWAASLSKINIERIEQSRPGGTWREWDDALHLSCHKKESGRTYPSVYGRMAWNEPSPTITTQFYGYGNGRFGHPEQNRAISIREGAMLQSFPPDYIFFSPDDSKPSKKELGIHIGNAVPVNLGRAIGESIQQHISEVLKNG